MKKVALMLSLVLATFAGQAQILRPIKWSFTAVKKSTGLYKVHMTATIDKDWTTYSQWTPAGGPEPTLITFNKTPNVVISGKAREVGEMKKKHEETFGVDIHYFAGKVDFVQVVKLKKSIPTTLTGSITTMACDAEQCLPPEEVKFSVELK